MKILVLNIEFPPVGGGASPVCHEIAKRLVLRGHSVTIVTMHFKGIPKYEIVDGIEVIRLACWRKKIDMSYLREHLFFIFQTRIFLRKYLQDHKFDICHVHFLLPCGIIARWIKKKFGIPYVITSHGSDVPGYNPDRFRWVHSFTPKYLQKIINDARFVVSPSEFLLGLIRQIWNHDQSKLKHIPNGIDKKGFKPKAKKPIILSTGRLLRRKGFHRLIEAVSEIESEYEVHICGDGPMMPELKALSKISKTSIILHGWLDNQSQEYRDLLSKSAIYCLVSERENASIAILEAMASGCAVITSDTHGCIEMVADSGICIPSGSSTVLSEKLDYLINNPQIIDNLGKKAIKRIQQRFEWESIVDRYEELLAT